MSMRLTVDQLLLMAEMLAEKRTAREIGAVMGMSKSAVIGHVWRHPDLKAIGFANPPNGGPGLRTRLRQELRARMGDSDYHYADHRMLPPGKPLEKLQSIHCRFPLWADQEKPAAGKMLFCGAAREADSSYCTVHRNLCHGMARSVAGGKRRMEP